MRVALLGRPGRGLRLSRDQDGKLISSVLIEPRLTAFWEKIEVFATYVNEDGREVLEDRTTLENGGTALLSASPDGPEYRIRAEIVRNPR